MRLKSLLLLSLTILFAAGVASSQTSSTTSAQVVNRAFPQNGHIQLHLQAGDYEIRSGKEDKIHVEWTAKSSKIDKVKVDLTTSGTNANLKITTPNNGDVHIVIEVPAKSGLYVRMTAGDLRLEGVEGDKDIELRAGDLDIDIGDPDSYGPIDASVKIGDLNADAFGVTKDGFGNHFRRTGSGKYSLHAHAGVGDLRLYARKRP